MADDQDAVLRELQEEMRREQLAKLWDRYGIYAIAVATLIVIGVGGYKFMEARRIAAAEAAGARYEAALQLVEDGKAEEAQQAFRSIAASAPVGYASLARLEMAGRAAKSGKSAEALTIYGKLADDTSVDDLFRQYARLQTAALKVDTADFTELQNRLTPLLAETSAWRFSARELLGLAAFKAGRMNEARQTFLELAADQKTPPSIRERAGLMMALITAAESGQSPPAPAQPVPGGSPPAGAAKVQ